MRSHEMKVPTLAAFVAALPREAEQFAPRGGPAALTPRLR